MPKYDFRHPTLSSNVTLTYPTASGTFALTSQLGGAGFSLNNASSSRLIISDGTSTAATASATLTYVSPYLTLSGSTAATNTSNDFLILRHDSTGTVAQGFGVGIDFRGENASGTTNVQIGSLDYRWESPDSGSEWGYLNISVNKQGTASRATKYISAGMEHTFGGNSQYVAATTDLGDGTGIYPNYRVYVYGETTDGTVKILTFATPTAASSTRIALPPDTTWLVSAYVVARRTDADNESAAYWIRGAIDNNAGVTALVGLPQVTELEDTVGWGGATIDSIGGLVVQVQGVAGSTIRWNGYVDIVQVSG